MVVKKIFLGDRELDPFVLNYNRIKCCPHITILAEANYIDIHTGRELNNDKLPYEFIGHCFGFIPNPDKGFDIIIKQGKELNPDIGCKIKLLHAELLTLDNKTIQISMDEARKFIKDNFRAFDIAGVNYPAQEVD